VSNSVLVLWDQSVSIEMRDKRVIAGVMLVLLVGAFVTLSVSRRVSSIEIEGHVYAAYDQAGHAPVSPVGGAKVSNDWDSATATTDSLGTFHLRIRRVAEDEWIKFTARAGDMAACERRLGSLTPGAVDIVLKDPDTGPGRCQPN
jgi:hypothetical protein